MSRRERKTSSSIPKLSAHDIRALAVASHSDPRTVRALVEGRPIQSVKEAAIRDAARRLGLTLPTARMGV